MTKMTMMLMSLVKTFKLLKSAQVKHYNNAWQVYKPERPIKRRRKLSCRHERQIREGKSAEQKAKPYQWSFCVRIKFIL